MSFSALIAVLSILYCGSPGRPGKTPSKMMYHVISLPLLNLGASPFGSTPYNQTSPKLPSNFNQPPSNHRASRTPLSHYRGGLRYHKSSTVGPRSVVSLEHPCLINAEAAPFQTALPCKLPCVSLIQFLRSEAGSLSGSCPNITLFLSCR
jgi:hypothetical protein